MEPTGDSYARRTLTDTPPSKVASVLAMDQMGVPRNEIARREHMGKATVYAILKQGDHMDQAIVERVKKNLAAHFMVTAERSLQHITDEKLEKATANALMWTAGVATDKALLLDGKPTSRVEFQSAADQEMAAQVEALQAELDSWKDGTTVNVEGSLGGTEGQASTERRS